MVSDNGKWFPNRVSFQLHQLVQHGLYYLDACLIILSFVVVVDDQEKFMKREEDLLEVKLVNNFRNYLA